MYALRGSYVPIFIVIRSVVLEKLKFYLIKRERRESMREAVYQVYQHCRRVNSITCIHISTSITAYIFVVTVAVWSGVNVAGVRLPRHPLGKEYFAPADQPDCFSLMHSQVVNRCCSHYIDLFLLHQAVLIITVSTNIFKLQNS